MIRANFIGMKGKEMARWIKSGSKVLVRKWTSKPGEGLTYRTFVGVLQEDCRDEGWDVVDVKRASGRTQSVYSFTVERVNS